MYCRVNDCIYIYSDISLVDKTTHELWVIHDKVTRIKFSLNFSTFNCVSASPGIKMNYSVFTQQNPPLITKQCSEETIPSLVEIMSDDEVSGSGKLSEESTQLLSPEGSFLCREQVDGSPGTEVFPDYVTLNKDSVVLCTKGNKYVVEYETSVGEKEAPAVKNELFQTCNSSCADGSVCTKPCCTDFLNHSYLLLAEPADGVHCKVIATRVPGNLYTNLPCS